MDFNFYSTKSEILSQYIEYYYEGELTKSYIAYPHYNTPLAFIKNTNVEITNFRIDLKSDELATSKVIVASKNVFPIYANVHNTIKDFSIVFKPYGLAQFLKNPLKALITNESAILLDEFNDFYDQNPTFFENSIEEKIIKIDNYLLSKLNTHKNLEYIIPSLDLYKKDTFKINSLSSVLPLSLKTYNRAFQMNCGTTPIKYKRIIQFRKALELLKKNEIEQLIDIALISGYYDQPSFNNEFKKMTKLLPSNFFDNIKVSLEKEIYFGFNTDFKK